MGNENSCHIVWNYTSHWINKQNPFFSFVSRSLVLRRKCFVFTVKKFFKQKQKMFSNCQFLFEGLLLSLLLLLIYNLNQTHVSWCAYKFMLLYLCSLNNAINWMKRIHKDVVGQQTFDQNCNCFFYSVIDIAGVSTTTATYY